MSIKKILCKLILLACIYSPAYAKNQLVDAHAPSCSDLNSEIFCHISAAIAAANENDVIQIAPGVYQETLVIDKHLSLIGNSLGDVIINGMQKGTVLTLEPGVKLKLSNIVLENGRGQKAGGILSFGSLWINQCIVRDNVSLSSGGGIVNASSVSGSILIENSKVENNIALGDDPNHVKYGGGGIFNNAPLQIMRSSISSNISIGNGGGIYSIFAGRSTPSDGELAAEKIGIVTARKRRTSLNRKHQSGAVQITEVQISDNVAEAGGGIYVQGVLDIKTSVVERNRAAFGDRSAGGGLYAHFDAALNIEDSRIRKNMATYLGGGLRFYSTRTALLSNVSIDQNEVLSPYGRGGGVYIIKGSADFQLYNSSLMKNFIAENIASDCYGKAYSSGYNYIGNSDKCDWQQAEGDFILH